MKRKVSGKRKDRAVKEFKRGFNCSQAVLLAFGPSSGLERRTAARLAQAFGAGMARAGETCGAVTGAYLVIGLKHGKTLPDDEPAKEKTYALAQEFARRFKARHGSLLCRRLLGHSPGTKAGMEAIKRRALHDTLCPRLVRSSVEILERLFAR